jgi:hypothetical protein
MRPRDRPLWTCPKCGARLVGRNMWHACGDYSVEGFLAGRGARARALFARFVDLVESCGPVLAAPAKTRVAFMVRVRFCAVERLSEGSLRAEFGLPYALDSPRIAKVQELIRGWHVHWFTVRSPDELDDEVRGWLCRSYRLMGEQRRFDGDGVP